MALETVEKYLEPINIHEGARVVVGDSVRKVVARKRYHCFRDKVAKVRLTLHDGTVVTRRDRARLPVLVEQERAAA